MAHELNELVVVPIRQVREMILKHLSPSQAREILGNCLPNQASDGKDANLIAQALTADCLRVVTDCVYANGTLSEAESDFLVPLVRAVAKLFGETRPEYLPFVQVAPEAVYAFFTFYRHDERFFGYICNEAKWCGLQICANVLLKFGDDGPVKKYESFLRGLAARIKAIDGTEATACSLPRDCELAISRVIRRRQGQAADSAVAVHSGKPLLLQSTGREGNALSISPDGATLALAGKGKVVLWDIAARNAVRRLSGKKGATAETLVFTRSGESVCAYFRKGFGEGENKVRVFDSRSGEVLRYLDNNGESIDAKTLIRHPTEEFVLAGVSGGEAVLMFNPATGETISTLSIYPQHYGSLHAIALSSDGSLLAACRGGYDNDIRVFAMKSGERILTIWGHADDVTSVAFSATNDLIVSASKDGTVRVWDSSTGKLLHRFEHHEWWVNQAVFAPTGDLVYSAGQNTVCVWDIASGKLVRTLQHDNGVECIEISPDGKTLVASQGSGSWVVWDLVSEYEDLDQVVEISIDENLGEGPESSEEEEEEQDEEDSSDEEEDLAEDEDDDNQDEDFQEDEEEDGDDEEDESEDEADTEPSTIRVGNWYQDECGDISLLAQIAPGSCALVCVKSGNRYTEGVRVKHVNDLTQREWKRVSSGGKFSLVEEKVFYPAASSSADDDADESHADTDDIDESARVKVGDWFKDSEHAVYVLAQTAPNMCALLSLADGNRYVDEVEVEDVNALNKEEWQAVAGGNEFSRLTEKVFQGGVKSETEEDQYSESVDEDSATDEEVDSEAEDTDEVDDSDAVAWSGSDWTLPTAGDVEWHSVVELRGSPVEGSIPNDEQWKSAKREGRIVTVLRSDTGKPYCARVGLYKDNVMCRAVFSRALPRGIVLQNVDLDDIDWDFVSSVADAAQATDLLMRAVRENDVNHLEAALRAGADCIATITFPV